MKFNRPKNYIFIFSHFITNRKINKIYLHFKEILKFRKLRKTHLTEPAKPSQVNINQIKSETSITTKTLINEHLFVETEFLPTKPPRQRSIREAQVNMLLFKAQNVEYFTCLLMLL